MTWLLWSTAALVTLMFITLTMGLLAANSHIDAGDIEADDDEEDDPATPGEAIVFDFTFIRPMPPFPISQLGLNGQHDRYPITQRSRQVWIDMLDASWKLPARERTS